MYITYKFHVNGRVGGFFYFLYYTMFLLTKKSKIDMLKRAESKGFPLNNKLRAQIRDKTVKVSEWKDEISDAKRWLSFKITTKDDKLRKKLTTLKRGAVLFGFPIDTKTFLSMQTRPSEVDYFLGAWRDYKKEGRRGRRSRSVVVVPLDLSNIYVVDIAGKPFILIFSIHRF